MKLISVLLVIELGSRCGEDVLIGSALLQVECLLFFQDEETEESGCSLQASAPFTECLQAERCVSAALALLHTNTHKRI